jgi:hypothetical protein
LSASPACRTADIPPAARRLAIDVDIEATADATARETMQDIWPHIDDAAFDVAVRRSTLAYLRTVFDVIAGRRDLASAAPEGALELAEVTAQLDIPATEIERAYRLAIASLWTTWFDIAREHAERRGEPLDDLLRGPMLAMLGCTDRIVFSVISRYEAIRRELQQTRRDLRRLMVRQIVEGSITEITDELNRTLDYALGDTHVALLLEAPPGGAGQPDREIATLRAAAGARATLVLRHGAQSWIVWLGFPDGFGPMHRWRLSRALAKASFTVAVGEPADGLAGMRRTHEQALAAARIQQALGPDGDPCVWARDVRLELLLLNDPQRAREFVADELGPLAGSGEQAKRIRDTLLAWSSTWSLVSAAALLGVHENTVRNRIRTAEELLDTPLLPPRTALQVALRLANVLSVTP